MSKYEIKVQDNKIIFDGHAADNETCKAITNICNSLSQTNKTIEYRDGYAEFEVGDVNELKFPVLEDLGVQILSNDGTQILGEHYFVGRADASTFITINPHSIILSYYGTDEITLYENNNKNILGLTNEINGQVKYPVNTTANWFAGVYIPDTGYYLTTGFYIIEEDLPRMRHLDKTGLQYFWNKIQSKFLSKNNTVAFTPTADYQPATKKYVDEHGGGATVYLVTWTNEDPQN